MSQLPQVGVPDPELRTSPIIERDDDDLPSLDYELEEGVCFFNDVSYPLGQFVRSGNELLKCTERGVWLRTAEIR